MDNNYLSIAKNDYLYAKSVENSGFNNNIAVNCQQVCEKLLKSVIVSKLPNCEDKLRSHNLARLYDTVSDEIILDRDVELYLYKLKDFYFDARYPGDDFVNVSDKDVEESIRVMDIVYKIVTDWHSSRSNRDVDSMLDSVRSISGLNSNK